jgi:hypothetical protein
MFEFLFGGNSKSKRKSKKSIKSKTNKKNKKKNTMNNVNTIKHQDFFDNVAKTHSYLTIKRVRV